MNETISNTHNKANSKQKLTAKQKKILIISGCSIIGTLLLVYLGFALYFSNHFFFGTTINNIDCSSKSMKETEEIIQQYMDTYTLTIEERNGKVEYICSNDFDLKAVLTSDVSDFKKNQNGFAWPLALFKDYHYTIESEKTYNKDKLNQLIDRLDCLQDAKMTEPVSAYIELSGNTYKIVPEEKGTKTDKDKTRSCILEAVESFAASVNLEEADCYIAPPYTSTSEKLIETIDSLNTSLSAKITYDILGNTEVIDSDQILSWLSWNENYDISISVEGVADVVNHWASSYDTSGKPHTLNTSYGTTVTIDKGNYGWEIDVDSTTSELIQAIKEGGKITKEPVYSKMANSKDVSKDYGNTYVEINLGTQHLYFYKDGALVVESDFVSGKVTNGNATPTGIYGLTYKQSPAVLRGPGYASPVKYWMPFNGGVGMHDASWRHGKFGGNIFYNNGSHGCINLPTAAAKTIYENISGGCAIIVYDQKIETEPLDDVTLTQEEIDAANSEQDANSAVNAGITDTTPEINVENNTVLEPTVNPTPTPVPSVKPTATPTPSPKPTMTPTPSPSIKPSPSPTPSPSLEPTIMPTLTPSSSPSLEPSNEPT